MNIPPSPSQLPSSTTGVPVMLVPSKLRPFGSPSIVVCISASLSRLLTVAGFIGLRSVHFGLPGSSRSVSITLLSTSTSGSAGSPPPPPPLLLPLSTTRSLSASVPESWNSTCIILGVLGFSSLLRVYFTFLFTGFLSGVYS